MKKKVNSVLQKIRNWSATKKFIFAIILIIFSILLVFSIFRVYLYVKFLLGNDIIVRLDSDKTDLFLENGQTEQVSFTIKGIASPLCPMKCQSKFQDVSKNKILSQENFNVKANEEKISLINITANGLGLGQDLYRFSVSCHNLKTAFCATEEEPMKRTILLTVNRELNSYEKVLKEKTKQTLESDGELINSLSLPLDVLDKNLIELKKVADVKNSEQKLDDTVALLDDSQTELSGLLQLWTKQNYEKLNTQLPEFSSKTGLIKSNYEELNQTIFSDIFSYNELVINLSDFRNKLISLSQSQYDESQVEKLRQIILSFNKNISLFEKEKNFSLKKLITAELLKTDLSGFEAQQNGTYVDETIYFNLTTIDAIPLNFSAQDFSLAEPIRQCCVFNSCADCCYTCSNENYPIIFVHGYAFNYGISAEFSVNIFDKLQDKLDADGYINAGEIYYAYQRTNVSGILGEANIPLTYRSSYYFDLLEESGDYIPVQTKSENIDTYAIRLKNIIEEIKYQTGKDKVRIIAHSMGGLVTRRYVQVFGNESVDRIILIGVPNKGISGSIKEYCSILGSSSECDDMDSKSAFINKLNSQPSEKVLTYNIIGSGCEMSGGDGDGIVLADSSYLETADKNFFIEGECSGFTLLHATILNTEVHPEVLRIIEGSLES
jgi:hypothetical protein